MNAVSPIDTVAWIHINHRKVLGVRSKGKDVYYLPGGKRHAGESDEEALVREIYEELSVSLLRQSVKLVGRFEGQAHGEPEGVTVKRICYSGDYDGALKANSEIEEICWLSATDTIRTSIVDGTIVNWLKQKDLID